ncbi:MAG: lysine--tRNA ligase [Solirubrobacterales bacterium]|nr:lysine--tRNA ligase [Solirubrobacterales bacterium]
MHEETEATPEPPEESTLIAERRAKLARLRDAGLEPFPAAYPGREPVADVRGAHSALADGEETEVRHTVAGRVMAKRGHGKAAFIDLRDGTGQIQLHSREDVLGIHEHELLLEADLGDFIGVEGVAFKSRRGELSLRLESWRPLAKSLRPLPDKHAGLADVETRFRHRELDLIANPEVLERFKQRAQVIAETRSWLDGHGFIEVETPILQPLYGGALARPFTTHHNALDRDLYLRIATELYLKRCVVGGIDRVYELGKDFRNEGVSPKHNPEFTMLEWYEAYADYEDAAARLEDLVVTVARTVFGATQIERGGASIDLDSPWRRVTMRDAIVEATGVDLDLRPSREELIGALGSDPGAGSGWGKLVDQLFSKRVEPGLIQPTFVMDYPVELSPFAKRHRSKEGVVERWEAFLGGVEIANAFSELNDPDEQRRRFEQQAEEMERGDADAQPHDEDFLRALEQGMPPTAGVGLGIDRLVMLLTGAPSLREVLLFPAMR